MIGRIKGRLMERHNQRLVVDVHGVGYEVFVPGIVARWAENLRVGDEVELVTLYLLQMEPGRATPMLLGFGLWLLVGWCWWRRKGKGQRTNEPLPFGRWWAAIGAQIALALAVGALSLWAMAADFKGGWFPPIESAVLTWAVACPLNWFLWAKSLREPLPLPER